jgi:type I restriction enzyme, S subunit
VNAELMQCDGAAARDGAADLTSVFDLVASAPDGVKLLKDLIVLFAVQGRLVAQRSSEEPAAALTRKIRQLMPPGKAKVSVSAIVPDELPFEIPDTWQWVRLADFIPFRIGRTPPTKDARYWCTTKGIPWVSIGDMQHLGVVRSTARKVTPTSSALFGYRPLPVGTLLMSFKLTIGKVAVLGLPAYHNEAIVSFFPLAGVTTDFLQIVLPWAAGRGLSKGAIKGATLNSQSLANLLIPVPPLREQERIAKRFSELMDVCELLEQAHRREEEQHARLTIELLDSLPASDSRECLKDNWLRVAAHSDLILDRAEAVDVLEGALVELAVRGLLLPQDTKEEATATLTHRNRESVARTCSRMVEPINEEAGLFSVPPNWTWVTLGEVSDISSGVTLGRKKTLESPMTVPYLRVANVQRGSLTLDVVKTITVDESELARFALKVRDLLITEGGDWDKVGRAAIWRGEIQLCLHQNHIFRVHGVTPEWNEEWAELYLNSSAARSYFSDAAKQTTNLASINSTQLKRCPIPLPPLPEQRRIVAQVTELRKLCAKFRDCLKGKLAVQGRLSEAVVEALAGGPG